MAQLTRLGLKSEKSFVYMKVVESSVEVKKLFQLPRHFGGDASEPRRLLTLAQLVNKCSYYLEGRLTEIEHLSAFLNPAGILSETDPL